MEAILTALTKCGCCERAIVEARDDRPIGNAEGLGRTSGVVGYSQGDAPDCCTREIVRHPQDQHAQPKVVLKN